MEDQLLHIKRFCTLYACGTTKAYELIAAGEVEAVKIGGATRITAKSAAAWASRLPKKTTRRSHAYVPKSSHNPERGDDHGR